MKKTSSTPLIILGLLNHEPMTGYEIRQRVEQTIKFFWDIGYGQIYPELKKLHKEEAVIFSMETNSTGARKKRYCITDKGKLRLQEWLAEPPSEERLRMELLVKLFLGSSLGKQKTTTMLSDYRERCLEKLSLLKLFEQSLLEAAGESEDHLHFLTAVRYGIKFYETGLNWAGESIRIIEKGDPRD